MTRASLPVGAVVAALALSACGGGTSHVANQSTSGGSTSTSSSTAASSGTSSAPVDPSRLVPIANAAVGDEVSGLELTQLIVGSYQQASTGHVVMTMGEHYRAEGDFRIVGGQQDLLVDVQLGDEQFKILIVDGVEYLRGPQLGDGSEWIASDSSEAAIPDPSTISPTAFLSALRPESAKVTAKNAQTTTYAVEVDPRKSAEAASGTTPPGVELPKSVAMSLTVDGKGRPTEATVELGQFPAELTYSDWGKKVQISAPSTTG